MIESYASEVGGREVTSLVSELLPVLIDKAGDNNTRIRYGAAAMFGADTHRQNPHAVPQEDATVQVLSSTGMLKREHSGRTKRVLHIHSLT